MPADTVSWEQIMDFKADLDSKAKYYALINWINETSKSNLSFSEIEDKFKYLYHEYCQLYERHKMATKFNNIEVLITGAIDIISNIATARAGSLLSTLYKIKKENLQLLKDERSFSGRELAYIHKVNNTF